MAKQDVVTRIVNASSEDLESINGIILTQIGNDREKIVKAIQIGFLRKNGKYLPKEELTELIGILGYGIQEKTNIDFGYCGEECMNGNGDMNKKFTCHHIKSLCEYEPVEQNLGKSSEGIASYPEEFNLDLDKEIDYDLEEGRLLSKINEEEGRNAPNPTHGIALFFCSEYRRGLRDE